MLVKKHLIYVSLTMSLNVSMQELLTSASKVHLMHFPFQSTASVNNNNNPNVYLIQYNIISFIV